MTALFSAVAAILLGCHGGSRRASSQPLGTLTVASTPAGADVTVDGTSTQQRTPCTLEAQAGELTVDLNLQGFEAWSTRVTVAAGQVTSVAAQLVPSHGTLAVTSVPPGAAVFVAGTDTMLQTPASLEVPSGAYHLLLRLPGHEDWQSRETITGGRTTSVNATLRLRCPGGVVGDLRQPPSISLVDLMAGATTIRGIANNVDASRTAVVLWALTNQYYVQPLISTPFTTICGDGSWSNWTHPWNTMVALLVDRGVYAAGATRIYHPSLDPGVLAWAQFPPRRPGLPLQFAGQAWDAKTSVPHRFDPGPNYWSDSADNVWVDSQGMHLRIVRQGSLWTCAEVMLTRSLGHGTYLVQLDSALTAFASNVVAAFFLYENPTREIDIEWSRDLVSGPEDAQFVVQPYTLAGNITRFLMSPAAQTSHRIDWRNGSIDFLSWRGHGPYPPPTADVISSWHYAGPSVPPPGGERLRFNLWLLGGNAPTSGSGDELIVKAFTFTP